jgi:hypothetical protein
MSEDQRELGPIWSNLRDRAPQRTVARAAELAAVAELWQQIALAPNCSIFLAG